MLRVLAFVQCGSVVQAADAAAAGMHWHHHSSARHQQWPTADAMAYMLYLLHSLQCSVSNASGPSDLLGCTGLGAGSAAERGAPPILLGSGTVRAAAAAQRPGPGLVLVDAAAAGRGARAGACLPATLHTVHMHARRTASCSLLSATGFACSQMQ